MPTKLKSKSLLAPVALALGVCVGASWTPAPAVSTPAPSAMPQFTIIETPVQVIDRAGIIIRIDPPELSAVFPVLP